jgi:Ca2+-dependent lipid-binding protein
MDEKLHNHISTLISRTIDSLDAVSSSLSVQLKAFEKLHEKDRHSWQQLIDSEVKARESSAIELQNSINEYFLKENYNITNLRQEIHNSIRVLLTDLIPKSVASELDNYFDWQK